MPRDLWGTVSDAVELRLTGQDGLFGLDAEAAKWVDRVLHKIETRDKHRKRRPVAPEYIDGVRLDRVKHTRHTSLGPELLGLHAWERLGMPDLLDRLGFNRAQRDAAAVSVINRLSFPLSENALPGWVKTSSLLDLLGEDLGRAHRDRFYRVSDRLLDHHRHIEKHLRKAQARHFNLHRTLVLYDLTNSHFEGVCAGNPKAKRGANKQKRFDCPQITVGMVFDEYGFGLAHKTFAGNRGESTTVPEMVEELDKMTEKDETFQALLPPTVIVDAGLATKDNLKKLRKKGYAYLVNESRTNREKYAEQFAEEALFKPVPEREEKTAVKVRRIKVPALTDKGEDNEHDYVVLCRSDQRREKELAIRSRAEERFLEDVEKLARRLRQGNLKDPAKIGPAIGRLRERHSRVAGFYEINSEPNPEMPATETKMAGSLLKWKRRDDVEDDGDELMGCYVLRTTREDLPAEQIWKVYITLCKAEDGFRALKSDLGLRPNRHQTEDRADAHVFITVLAYHLLSFIRETLSRAGDRRSWFTLRQILQTHQYATVVIPTRSGTTYSLRKAGEPEECHRQIYRHFDISIRALPERRTETKQGRNTVL
jgi:transposase